MPQGRDIFNRLRLNSKGCVPERCAGIGCLPHLRTRRSLCDLRGRAYGLRLCVFRIAQADVGCGDCAVVFAPGIGCFALFMPVHTFDILNIIAGA